MHHGFALRYIPQVMDWNPEEENRETVWLRLMSEYKFDSYQDFRSGSRFVESLLDWLQQFKREDRKLAYQLVRERLLFLSFAEIQHLVRRSFPAFIRPKLAELTAKQLKMPRYLIWGNEQSVKAVHSMSKKSLYIGLSDGARLDAFRRANVGTISNEQVVLGYEISEEKWSEVHKHLKKELSDNSAQFELLVLLDDFAGSGTTLLRWDDAEKKWKGKLPKIIEKIEKHQDQFVEDYTVLVHHYVGTANAVTKINEQLKKAESYLRDTLKFRGAIEISFDMVLSVDTPLHKGKDQLLDKFLREYYDELIMSDSLRLGGPDVMHGFAYCALPLIMEHNTPNNSLSIFWAESDTERTGGSHQMRPLFRRRQRHF